MHSLLPHTAPYTKCPATCVHVRRDLPSPEKAYGPGKTSSLNLGTFQFTHQKHFLRCYASCLTIQGPHWDTQSPSAPATSSLTTYALLPSCSHLQPFWCTEGELVPISNLHLSASWFFSGYQYTLPTHMVFDELLPSCWFWQWPPTSWPSETTFLPLLPLFSLKTIKSGQSTYLEKSDPKNSSPNP